MKSPNQAREKTFEWELFNLTLCESDKRWESDNEIKEESGIKIGGR